MANNDRVLVIGAGPVGLCAALALRSHGIEVTVLEADPADRTRPGSRAIFLHHQSLRHLDAVSPGVAAEISEAGLIWSERSFTYRGKQVVHDTFPPEVARRYGSSLAQVATEAILMRRVVESGVEMVWGAPVQSVHTDDAGVVATMADGSTVRAPYAIACDGSRSATRTSLGIEMKGTSSDIVFVVMDVAELAEPAMPVRLNYHYRNPALDGRNTLIVPFQGGWRIDIQLHPSDDPDGSIAEVAAGWLRRIVDPRYAEQVTWLSTYRFHQLVAETFTDPHRRVLLAGEAAHLFPPWGGRGLNSGIFDAVDSAAAIAAALAAPDPAAAAQAIEACATDRHEAAEYNRHAATVGLNTMAPQTVWQRLRRRAAALLAPGNAWGKRLLAEGPTGLPGGRPGKALF